MTRPSARARGYGTKWEKARLRFLAENPLCRMCLADGRRIAARSVDHIIPHKGDQKLFWSRSNWQSLCKPHHDGTKQRMEARGVAAIGCDETGMPRNPAHHWRA